MKALVLCYSPFLSAALPFLLARAGFTVDVLTPLTMFRNSNFTRRVMQTAPETSIIDQVIPLLTENYDWIIVTDEAILQEIKDANIDEEIKLKLLPVLSRENVAHINSKIELAEVFKEHGILAPDYSIVSTVSDAIAAAKQLTFPVILKVDASGGGEGIYECHTVKELNALSHLFQGKRLLLQKKIIGKEIDLSGIFLGKSLIHLNYSVMKNRLGKFGPSTVREYHPTHTIDKNIAQEVAQLGEALGIHGFTNISCLETADKKRYYIEVDVRPSVWADYARFIDDDPAPKIHAWFNKCAKPALSTYSKPTVIPYFARVPLFYFLINRYQVWKYVCYPESKLSITLLLSNLAERIHYSSIRNLFPKRLRQALKNKYLT
jgi:hypothetical protein